MCRIALEIPNEVIYDTKMRKEEAFFARSSVALCYYVQNGVSFGYYVQIAGMLITNIKRCLGLEKGLSMAIRLLIGELEKYIQLMDRIASSAEKIKVKSGVILARIKEEP